MNVDEFDAVTDHVFNLAKTTLRKKNTEYSGGGDRLHHFKVAARIQDCSPELALRGMAMKHLVSILDAFDDSADPAYVPPESLIVEKINDAINYLVLYAGLCRERQRAARKGGV